jgi:hypothetical protein
LLFRFGGCYRARVKNITKAAKHPGGLGEKVPEITPEEFESRINESHALLDDVIRKTKSGEISGKAADAIAKQARAITREIMERAGLKKGKRGREQP